MSKRPKPIVNFDGPDSDHHFLSNFWPCTVVMGDGIEYPSAEHAFQAYKTKDLGLRKEISELPGPGYAKQKGRALKLRTDWEDVKICVMFEVLSAKFKDAALKAKLLGTEGRELVEGNTWNDTFWGVCRGKGKNWLGKLLMQVRLGVRDGR